MVVFSSMSWDDSKMTKYKVNLCNDLWITLRYHKEKKKRCTVSNMTALLYAFSYFRVVRLGELIFNSPKGSSPWKTFIKVFQKTTQKVFQGSRHIVVVVVVAWTGWTSRARGLLVIHTVQVIRNRLRFVQRFFVMLSLACNVFLYDFVTFLQRNNIFSLIFWF